jgi:hypothetical protein
MMSFDKFGFLSKDMKNISEVHYKEHKQIFDVCYKMNSFAQTLKSEMEIDPNNCRQVIASCFFIKIMNGFQAIILLFLQGLETEAKIITRTILESLFVLKAIADDKEEVRSFIDTDKKKKEKLLKNIFVNDNENIYITLKEKLTEKMLDELKQSNKKECIKDIQVYEWAKKANLLEYYRYVYVALSFEVHPDVRNLGKHLILDDNQKITEINCTPNTVDIFNTLVTACSLLIITINCLCKIFSLNYEKELEEFDQDLVCMQE